MDTPAPMKIALIQLNVSDHEPLWTVEAIPAILKAAKGVDLVVFPEGMPFIQTGKRAVRQEQAVTQLTAIAAKGPAFIAGGYVRREGALRNTSFLVENGKVLGTYDKRVKWRGEHFEPGASGVRFAWGGQHACIPLICADAGDNPSPTGTHMMAEAIALGADADVPIVIQSYGDRVMTSYWRDPLTLWAQGTGAPVAICAVTGKSTNTYFEDGESRHYGGGGSAVFWPDGTVSKQSSKRGVYIINTKRRSQDVKFVALPQVPN